MLRQIPALRVSAALAERNLRRCLRESLPEDFPAFVQETERRLPVEMRRIPLHTAGSPESVLLMLRPAAADRAENVAGLGRAPLLALARPASDLISGFRALCAELSSAHYFELYGAEARITWVVSNVRFIEQGEYKAFQTRLHDEAMIDYNEGDRWHKWRERATTVGSFVATLALLVHAGGQLAEASVSSETLYRRNIGKSVIVPDGGMREILDAKYFETGDISGHRMEEDFEYYASLGENESAEPEVEAVPIEAPSTGWFYDTGEGWIVRCDERTRDSQIYETFHLSDEDAENLEFIEESL